jgi:hypothetical protein
MAIPAIEGPRTPSPPQGGLHSLASSPTIEISEPTYDPKSLSPVSGTFPRYPSINEATSPQQGSPLSPSSVYLSPYSPNGNTSNGEDNAIDSAAVQPFNFRTSSVGRPPASLAAARQAVIYTTPEYVHLANKTRNLDVGEDTSLLEAVFPTRLSSRPLLDLLYKSLNRFPSPHSRNSEPQSQANSGDVGYGVHVIF